MTDANSVFYLTEKINKTLLNKARKSFCVKDKVFYKLYARILDQNIFDDDKVKVPIYTPFLEQKIDIDCSSALYIIKRLFELVHADVANIRGFLQLIRAIVFSLKFYVYQIKKILFSEKA